MNFNSLLTNDRRALAKAITLVESQHPQHRAQAQQLLQKILPHTGKSFRIGITGVPGVGKSTLIEALGLYLIEQGHKVAVLAVDPSSPISGGSLLADKTRMEELSRQPQAFIRPSPSQGLLGGVAQATRESILLCEAAGYDIVIVETVGVGQSEIEVASMVDFFMVLLLPNAGDEIQGLKKGIIELADALIITKADGEQVKAAEIAAGRYRKALHLLTPHSFWLPIACCCSALTGQGIDALWRLLLDYQQQAKANQYWQQKRLEQNQQWFDKLVQGLLLRNFDQHLQVRQQKNQYRQQVLEGKITPLQAAEQLVEIFLTREQRS